MSRKWRNNTFFKMPFMKLTCLLVDDEPPALKVLESYIESMDHLDIVGKCYNAFEAMQVLQQKNVDVIFLDIKMPRLLGTEFLRTIRHPPKIIFTTAHKDYAMEGFELDAVDYLLKPFSLERFIRAVNKITGINNAIPENAKEAPATHPDAFLYFRVDRKMIRVELEDIVYIESLRDYIKIIRVQQKPLIVKKSIGSIEEMLPGHQFLRVHRSYIIAINKVTAFTKNDVEIHGLEIPIGKIYRQQVNKFLVV